MLIKLYYTHRYPILLVKHFHWCSLTFGLHRMSFFRSHRARETTSTQETKDAPQEAGRDAVHNGRRGSDPQSVPYDGQHSGLGK